MSLVYRCQWMDNTASHPSPALELMRGRDGAKEGIESVGDSASDQSLERLERYVSIDRIATFFRLGCRGVPKRHPVMP